MMIFGIIGVNLFKGKFEYCDTSSVIGLGLSQKQVGKAIIDKLDCYNYGGTWKTYATQFNNIGISFDHNFTSAQKFRIQRISTIIKINLTNA